MIYDIPKFISLTDHSHQELYFIGEFVKTKQRGQYKFTKLNKNTCSKYILEPDKHIQSLIDKGIIAVVQNDELSVTYAMKKPIDLTALKPVTLVLLNRVVISPFPFKSEKGTEYKTLDDLKKGYNQLEMNYVKLIGMYNHLKEVFEFSEKQSKQ
jgi:hypothetical protein